MKDLAESFQQWWRSLIGRGQSEWAEAPPVEMIKLIAETCMYQRDSVARSQASSVTSIQILIPRRGRRPGNRPASNLSRYSRSNNPYGVRPSSSRSRACEAAVP